MKQFYLLFFLIFISCKNSYGISNAVQKVNKCYEGTNQIEVDKKAIYDEKNKILTFFIGQDENHSLEKWKIPMSKISKKNIFFENNEFPYIKIKTIKNLDIKYYKNEILNDSLSQFVYPIFDYCFKKKEIDKFILDLQQETTN